MRAAWALSSAESAYIADVIREFRGRSKRNPVCFTGGMTQDRDRTTALQTRSFEFTCGVIGAYPATARIDDPSRLLWRQLIKAASSATFNLEEADAASSDNDFLAKMRIALREAKESHVGIRVIVRCRLAGWKAVEKFQDEARQLAAIFGKIIVNKKASMQRKLPPNRKL